MNGKIDINIGDIKLHLWFNNFSKAELAKIILPKDGAFPAKPEEFPLLNAMNRLAEENYLVLMGHIIWTGVLGTSMANDRPAEIEKKHITNHIATATDAELHKIWICFLSAMGVNIGALEDTYNEAPKDVEDSKKKV